jgi:hypothetical protein
MMKFILLAGTVVLELGKATGKAAERQSNNAEAMTLN